MSPLPPPREADYFSQHTAAELAGELRDGRVSPNELVERALRAAARLDPVLNAFVTLDEHGAREAARNAAEELAAGVDRGPLHGIPVAIKDVLDTAGLRTTMGSRHFADRVPERDATSVRRLREAGAIIVGKTTTHEFAYGPTGDRSASGATRNPYQPGHMAGGSSCGSAVAVAAGIVPLSIGTDTGGSVRIPAACCGVVGLKPTHGAVPTDGVFPLAPSLDTVGPLARTAADCRLLWEALTGGNAGTGDAGTGGAGTGDAGPHTVVGGAPLRIGWVPPETLHPTEAPVTRAARAMLVRLPDPGSTVEEVALPGGAALHRAYGAIQGGEAHALHAERMAASPGLYDEEVLDRLRAAGGVSGEEQARARELREEARLAIGSLLRHHDLLALPTVPMPAPPVGTRSQQLAGTSVRTREALLSLTSPWSVVGLPALSLPAGLVDGLPVGLQLVARAGGEHLLLSVAQQLYDVGREPQPTVSPPSRPGPGTPPGPSTPAATIRLA
jgi:Asp-tRNA(Asn)/Glu-tRNA(Gln) amidotransferase A subunit family amidase